MKDREAFKTLNNVFDLFTEKNLFKLISQGHFEGIESPLFIGKEANIFTALTKEGKRVIIKIYRLSTCDFKQMYKYMITDPRYQNLAKNRRKVIFTWAQREYRNLLLAREAGVKVPIPYVCLYNILVMEYIGDEHAAPKLKDLPPKNPQKFYEKTLRYMKKLYKAGLIHADLSAFNILNYNEMPVFIDMSQSTPTDDPNSEEYFDRDIKNIANFFKKQGLNVEKDTLKKEILKN